ncbi:unnamed protein product [Brachionus calyciflorus]|uniref:HAT C-terminal dimerisation domain-containing protein n=1 Tax=Brachionus calyciflorus TaxID=104777 RepID=A0A813V3Z8_9BILA|nr:unnamed protein product [Brachionus calyciflorus]
MKFLVFTFSLLILENVQCFSSTYCPKVDPMPEFKWEPFLGNWHLYIASEDYVSEGDICFKNNHTLIDQNLLAMEQQYANGEQIDFTIVRNITRPGEVYDISDETLYGIFGQPYTGKATTYSTVTYTDYTSIQVRFICKELNHFWYTEAFISYYISIRDRSFDSIAKVAPHIEDFRKLGADIKTNIIETTDLPTILKCYEYDEKKLSDPDNKVKCKGCQVLIAFKLCDPTSNLVRHITKTKFIKHQALIREHNINSVETPPKTVKRKLIEINSNVASSSSQKNIKSYEEYKLSDSKKIKLDLKLCDLIISKSLPISFVDSVEFRDFANCLDQRYTPPNSQTVKYSLLPKLKKELKDILINKLITLDSLNILTDIWSDATMRSFIGFKAQGIDHNWKLVNVLLCCKHIIGSHTNESIFNYFLDVINEYKIDNKVFKILSDGASNMVKAFDSDHISEYVDTFLELCDLSEDEDKIDKDNIEESDDLIDNSEESGYVCTNTIAIDLCRELNEVERLNCTAHMLQLAIKDSLSFDCAEHFIQKISQIVNKGRHSCIVMDNLREVKKNLKAKNNTRWNSIYYMLKSFSQLTNSEIDSIIQNGKNKSKKSRKNPESEIKFTYEEREKLNELLQILQELQIATDIFQGDGITISRILPTVLTVLQKVDLKSIYENGNVKDRNLKNKIFYFENVNPLYGIASILDPNYGTTWIKPCEKSVWIDKLKSMVEEMDESESVKEIRQSKKKNKTPTNNWTISYEEESFSEPNLEYDIMLKKFFDAQKQSRLEAKEKIDNYIDPLGWWKENESKYPILAKMAKKILGVPATTGSVERFFSKTGYILRQHRRKMADIQAENLFFLKENREFYKNVNN